MRVGIGEFLWGLGLFLFGIHYLEQAVSVFSKRGFKQLIKKYTAAPASSLLTGLVSTVIVQSSNLISVLVLAFVGTGILSLTGALAVMLGSSIGTTIPDAFLGSIGLQYDIKILTFPLLFLGAVGMTFFSNREKVVLISKALIGLALIFLSFAFMKQGMLFVTWLVDFSYFMDMSPWIFFLMGLALTLLVQSWGAVFIITLTSASSGLITSEAALPIIFGTYLGATITIVIASLGHQPAIKKQVAMGHVGFNLIVAGLGMLTLPWIKTFVFAPLSSRWWEVQTLAALYVACRSIVAVFLFPFLGFFARVFQKYIHDEQNFALAVQRVLFPSFDFELALLALKQDLLVYLKKVISYNLHIWDFCLTDLKQQQTDLELILKQGKDFNKSYLKKEYLEIEKIQKELLDFLSKVHQTDIQKAEDADQVSSLYQVIIDIGDSSKYLKDVRDRVEDWQWSTSVNLQKDYEALRRMVFEFYQSVLALLLNLDNQQTLDFLHELLEKIEVHDKEYLTIFRHKEGDDIDLMKLIQVNRYFSMSCMALVKAIEHIRMDEEEKKYLKEHIEGLF